MAHTCKRFTPASLRAKSRFFRRDRSATTAVEFAMIAPVFLLLIHGIVSLGTINAIYSGIQQLAAESARASVAGVTAPERQSLARDFVLANAAAYAFIDPQKLALETSTLDAAFVVTLRYDMSDLFVYRLGSWMALPSTQVVRTAVVRFGGY